MAKSVSYFLFNIGRIQVFQEVFCPRFKIRFRARRYTYFDVTVFILN